MNVMNAIQPTERFSVIWARDAVRVVVTGPQNGPMPNDGQRVNEMSADEYGSAYCVEYGSGADWRSVYQCGDAAHLVRCCHFVLETWQGDLVAFAKALPDLPSFHLAGIDPCKVFSRPVPSVPPSADLLRPDGVQWAVEDVDEALGADPCYHGVNSDGYKGVCAIFGRKDNMRLIVNRDCKKYVLQSLHLKGGKRWWFAVKASRDYTLSGLLAKSKAYGLKQAAAGLPDDPAHALPEFALYVSAIRAAYALTDWRRDSYARVAAQSQNWRVAVSSCGQFYNLQTVAPRCWDGVYGSDAWRLVVGSRSSAKLLGFLDAGKAVGCPSELAVALGALPVLAVDCTVAEMPRRPTMFDMLA